MPIQQIILKNSAIIILFYIENCNIYEIIYEAIIY